MAHFGAFPTLRESILHRMRREIISLILKPGEVIRDNELTERYAVSTSPIREAMTQLVLENLVEALPNKRKRVTPLDEKSVKDFYDVHKIITNYGFVWGAPKVTAEGLRAMQAAHEKIEDAFAAKELEVFDRLMRIFLDPVYKASGNAEIRKRIIQSSPWMDRIDFINRGDMTGYELKRGYVHKILSALVAGDHVSAIIHQREMAEAYERCIFSIDFSTYSSLRWELQ